MTILKSLSVSSRETEVRNGIKGEKHAYFHQLTDRKVFVVFISARS
jgi:hypothetical protein